MKNRKDWGNTMERSTFIQFNNSAVSTRPSWTAQEERMIRMAARCVGGGFGSVADGEGTSDGGFLEKFCLWGL